MHLATRSIAFFVATIIAPAVFALTIDTFDPLPDAQPKALAVQADGRILLGDNFSHIGTTVRTRMARLNADGALDPTFGSGGKVQIAVAATGAGGSNLVATDVAVQSNGRSIVAGYNDNSDCVLARLNVDGSLDTSFGGTNGFSPGFTGYGGCAFTGVAIRPDDRIVAVANQGVSGVPFSVQFSVNGAPDRTFGSAGVAFLTPTTGDSAYISRVLIDTDGTIDVAGTYHDSARNVNRFLFVQISADGETVQPLFQYEFGSGNNQDDHALDLAIDGQGRYVIVGYHRGAAGNYDFAALRIRSDLYDVDNTFGSGGQTTVDFGDNGDYANAVALTPTGYIALGGQANGQAALALLDANGNLNTYFSGGLLYSEKFTFAFGTGGGNDTISKLILDPYDTKYPQLLAVGSGRQGGVPYGLMFGIARLDLPGTYSNFAVDTGFGSDGTEGVYFGERRDGINLLTTTNHSHSAALAHGKLVAVGDTIAPGGTAIAVTRLAAFDGIFKNGFDNASL